MLLRNMFEKPPDLEHHPLAQARRQVERLLRPLRKARGHFGKSALSLSRDWERRPGVNSIIDWRFPRTSGGSGELWGKKKKEKKKEKKTRCHCRNPNFAASHQRAGICFFCRPVLIILPCTKVHETAHQPTLRRHSPACLAGRNPLHACPHNSFSFLTLPTHTTPQHPSPVGLAAPSWQPATTNGNPDR
ncbi:uncharacterized protein BDCG_08000 [Blastomyces dermatitidis ER-3]|uniref:Uncharacterized protein n=1 Tax=Ajellomyces dermatitidis (strain ER-3 / ATCC MYA-2586) TaxID=559297 RepID=A0ABP2EP39_AJEDR|nr:uncharacterized protein BDCG_08000 [Blastomyces dermatitidis ER-3]EEQ84731.2 hypothetical protein BDCG_08000 [Blastomyces dermatitidis ER-3]